MSKIVTIAKEQIENIIYTAAKKAIAEGVFPEAELGSFKIETPSNREHGDYAVNAAMVWSKAFRNAPRKIAEELTARFNFEGSYVESAEIAGPGFINFFLSDKYYGDIVSDVVTSGENYGKSNYGQGKKVLVEFVSANPTGPMHIGNARGGALGDCLASVMDAAGYYVEREFYINDAGNQINKFGLSLDLRYLQIYKEGIEMPEDSYHGADIIAHAEAFAKIHGDKYVNETEEVRRKALVEFALPKNIDGLKTDLLKYRIEYNTWFKESSLHASGETAKIIELLKESGHTYTKEDALWFKGSDFDAEDFVLVRSNGVPTYVVPDIAYHYNKLVTRGFDKAIDVLGADHHGYVPRLKAALTALGVDASKLDVLLMQMVRLVKDGEVIKASKRSGKAITLVTLLDEVPIDAARFFFNLREPNSHFDFDLDLAVEESNKNPVYYVQYAHARICSILRKAEEAGIDYKSHNCTELLAEEIELIKSLTDFPAVVASAGENFAPSIIAAYAYDLAKTFNGYYHDHSILREENEEKRRMRVMLAALVARTISKAMKLLGIDVPQRM